ncbi:DDB1- and CUL4-associated factor 6-like [Centruroides vittatus]|uniref:DDB1- and CUL4-associated factor 6-like n=1 Tax=Centruroides vittatus TaxID=120091 RepID=UPI0035108030
MKSNERRLFANIWNNPLGLTSPVRLFDSAKDNKTFIQKLRLQVKLPVHNGCVNTICWNDNGNYLLSGSDDQHLCITNGYTHEVVASVQTGHRANIFSAKFLPNTMDRQVVSCSGDGVVIFSNLDHPESSMSNLFSCHFGTAYEIMTVPNDPHTFLSCGEDGTVRWFDLRMKTSCCTENCKEDVLINSRIAVTSIAVNPLTPYQLGIGCADGSVRIFDRRMLGTRATGNYGGSGIQAMIAHFTVPEFGGHSHRITSLTYSPDGEEMLVSYSSDYIYLFEVKDDCRKEPKVFGAAAAEKDNGNEGTSKLPGGKPVMKRLRVRGDWSDTGPNARPESEMRANPNISTATGQQQSRSLHASLMQRMSDVLTRMFNSPSRMQRQSAMSPSMSSHSSGTSSHAASDGDSSSDDDIEQDDSQQLQSANQENSESDRRETNNNVEASDTTTVNISENSNNESKQDEEPAEMQSDQQLSVNNPSTEIDSSSHSSSAISMTVVNEEHKLEKEAIEESLQDLEHELSNRRKDLIEKHKIEPMVNLHFSGQGVNSGLITMDVKSQAQGLDLPLVPEGSYNVPSSSQINQHPTSDSSSVTTVKPSSSSSATTTLQCIQENPQLDNVEVMDTAIHESCMNSDPENNSSNNLDIKEQETDNQSKPCSSGTDKSGSQQETSTTQEESADNSQPLQADSEPAVVMEMDTWEMESNSDEEITPRPRHNLSTRRRSSSGNIPDNILKSINEELRWRREEREREKVQIMNVPQPTVKRKFMGHRNARTMIKESTFWGNNYIMSGSDCGHVFVWDRYTSELIMIMEADHHVVNCLQPHPFDPVLATSGIDYDIKLWAPLLDEPFFDREKAQEIMKRNEVMLEETKDTITVPASFMIRMLASLNHLRPAGRMSGLRRGNQETDNNNTENTN